MIHLK